MTPRRPAQRIVLVAMGCCLAAAVSQAQVGPGGGRAQRALREYERLQADIQKYFQSEELDKAAAACEESLKRFPDDPLALYNLACAHARLKKPGEALKDLDKAVENGWDQPDHMLADEDLLSLRKDKKFLELVEASKLNERAGGKYEKGEEIAGVKTVEGFPEDGLRYRLRIPKDATAAKPARLIVWLHPSGGSLNAPVEKLAPEFAAHGFALMVFTHKQFMGWTTDEADALVHGTLPALKGVKEIDASRPVLMGYSAGGQLALDLWEENPAGWSGLILDSAYPVKMEERSVVGIDPPAKPEQLKKTPIRVIVGDKDAGLKRWEIAENKWLKAGVPLTVQKVEGKGHEWMMSGEVMKETLGWLDEIKAGKSPADVLQTGEIEI